VTYLKPEDYKRLSKPKKLAGTVAGFWGLGYIALQSLYIGNPETFFRRFLFTPFSALYFIAVPVSVTYLYMKS
jgi:hypothetical protein